MLYAKLLLSQLTCYWGVLFGMLLHLRAFVSLQLFLLFKKHSLSREKQFQALTGKEYVKNPNLLYCQATLRENRVARVPSVQNTEGTRF